jgi:hypothetical protein
MEHYLKEKKNKKLKAKRVRGMAEVEECLPNKDKGLSSSPSTSTKKKKIQLQTFLN